MNGVVQIRLMGCPADVEVVAEYLRASRTVQDESEDEPCRREPEKILRYMEVRREESNRMTLAR